MALTLIKEDGSGKANANSYAAAADGDTFHDGHLYAAAWTAATAADKEKALVFATRVVDGMFRFRGFKRVSTQALQWPRSACREPEAGGAWVDEMRVPSAVRDATCELARELLRADRTDAPDGEGLWSLTLEGALKVVFDPAHRRPMVPPLVQALLGRYGDYLGRRGSVVRLVRC
ncbi:MAG: hypothetical protein HZA90_26350 [Verrucomicrobia bacterium]|nr:hypothetical protein [Verrucomicrobiota bacterium]